MGEGIPRSRTKVFLAVNYFGKKTYKINRMFFKNCNLGEGILPRYIKEACDAVWVIGEWVRDHFTAHGLRATCITFLFQAGHQKEVV